MIESVIAGVVDVYRFKVACLVIAGTAFAVGMILLGLLWGT